jgi:hypothetical protein
MRIHTSVLIVLTLGGCAHAVPSAVEATRAKFSRTDSCPDERIVVSARHDLVPKAAEGFSPPPIPPEIAADPVQSEAWRKIYTPEIPAPKVAADPERLSVWKANHRRALADYLKRQRLASKRGKAEIVAARGCGATRLYVCVVRAGKRNPSWLGCDPIPESSLEPLASSL